ncbi:hypothetical protein [Streptomyces sp. UNOC14_S4]|nr:hypothetical protein [Streptomyces sp. UNOC14_S4]
MVREGERPVDGRLTGGLFGSLCVQYIDASRDHSGWSGRSWQ